MGNIYRLETARVVLRQWQSEDYAEFANMNADPDVMRYFPSLLSREESDTLTKKFDNLVIEKGWGFWVAERKSDSAFMGLVGLNQADDLPVTSCVEVGWRLAKAYWGRGYATETAAASLHFAFSILEQDRVAAFTTLANSRSREVMSRLGMKDRQENFLHPRVSQSSGLKEHVYYQISRERFYRNFKEDCVTISSQ
ncbi:MAG: GNAT family N-acetyltransferase [SAR86 cluster bacterium]|uniref:GNAT family N-acetyltransferase n=1 Tax=SAR86 cluster bacterium TaxID=2030880 RepID=A0A2A4X3J8_9GAMM|nr:MAG: GNAT family N-acetyltransferase [SAR86 cluster bacterium]